MREVETVRDLRRAQILRAARGIVAERGVGALTFGALERELAFTRGVITYHFANKDEIVDALLDDAIAEIAEVTLATVGAGVTPVEKLGGAVGGMVRGFLTKPEAARVLLSFWGRLPADARAAAKNAALFRRWRDKSASLVHHLQKTGAARSDCDVDAVAAHMVGIVIGAVTQSFFDPGAVDPDATVAAAVHALAGSLAPPAS